MNFSISSLTVSGRCQFGLAQVGHIALARLQKLIVS
jgi:hypothetical protein